MVEAWIRFMAPVTPQTAGALMRVVDTRLATGAQKLHLMISSPGGSVFHGLSVHNFLRGCGAEVSTYNFGSVDSIGVVVFCAGTARYCVPSSRFHIHGVKLQFRGEFNFDEKALEEHLKLLKTDYMNIARVIATTSGRTEDQVFTDMNNQTSLMPEQAKEYGLVHEVRNALMPAQAGLTVIYEDASIQDLRSVPVAPSASAEVEVVSGTVAGFTGSDGACSYLPRAGTYF